jgi:hypothetical protein
MFKKLRRIAFASMFVLDVCGPRVAFGEEEYEDEDEPNGHQDTSMELDEHYDDGEEEYETNGERDAVSDMQETLSRNIGHLAVWADKFLDEHLRMPPPFGEIWFVDNRFAGHVASGYDQMVTMGDDGRVEHIISHHPPDRKRAGWWWNENDPISLD